MYLQWADIAHCANLPIKKKASIKLIMLQIKATSLNMALIVLCCCSIVYPVSQFDV